MTVKSLDVDTPLPLVIVVASIEGFPVTPATPITWQQETQCSECYFSMSGRMSLGYNDFILNYLYNDGLNPLRSRDFDHIEKTEASMMLCRVICAVTENGGQYQVETRQQNDRQARSSRSQSRKVNARNEEN
ncbi:hypothetical protein PRIPAC_82152 [Pristionchus pacificus]|uniref:Uncharacterized protein n=1 Tax=Pristionchus pacificus TaxID=54126 RepID=A0A2A6CJQ8_PRIPA|nr:hypothetical protein PRIPAC_82152 [Pristionchus pacificus]|eukprot:PDM78350.1 hypothetical protein PRIPAC_30929 [Pristionchus pacificus]